MADCDCSQCPGAEICTCIYTYEDGICVCICQFPIILPAFARERPPQPRSAKIDLCVKNLDLLSLANFLDSQCDGEVLLPASRAKEVVSVNFKNLSVMEAAEKVGLRIVERPTQSN